MTWKQPIPTNLKEIFGEDYRCMGLYKELILRACNKDNAQILLGDNSKIVTLNRGQVLYGRVKYGRYLCWDDKTTDRALKKLAEKYKKVTMVRTPEYTIVTLLNYEDIVDMTKWRPSDDQVVTTSKSVKIVNNEKNIVINNKEGGDLSKYDKYS